MTTKAEPQTSSTSSYVRLGLCPLPIQQVSRLLVWKALLGFLLFDLLGFGRSFARLHRYVRRYGTAKLTTRVDVIDSVCTAVNYACVWYPRRVLCLQRSAVTTCLLRKSGLPAQMVIGTQSLPFKAHAWTELHGHALNERRDVQRIYQFLDRF